MIRLIRKQYHKMGGIFAGMQSEGGIDQADVLTVRECGQKVVENLRQKAITVRPIPSLSHASVNMWYMRAQDVSSLQYMMPAWYDDNHMGQRVIETLIEPSYQPTPTNIRTNSFSSRLPHP